jgi:hypothetical protein
MSEAFAALVELVTDWAVYRAPKALRIGCTLLLLLMAAALIAFALWPRSQ